MSRMKNKVKRAILQNRLTIGSWLQIGSSTTAEIMANAGFEWLAIDAEHGAIDLGTAVTMMQAMKGTGCVPMVRVQQNEPICIRRFLDAGAYGIIVPRVNSGAEAEAAVRAAKYPPAGERGIGMARAHDFSSNFEAYMKSANEETILMAQIEHIDAVENIDEIVGTPGVDGVFVGPYDLSGSMGLLGKLKHPEIKKAVERTLRAAQKRGIAAGMHVVPPSVEQVKAYVRSGYRFIAFSLDTVLLQTAIRQPMKELEKLVRRRNAFVGA